MLPNGISKVIAIGASTGGVEALEAILTKLPASIPPVVLVLHMPIGFTKLYAARLNGRLPLAVKEAASGDILTNGQILIAPAGQHMTVKAQSGQFKIVNYIGEKIQGVMPAADVLFESLASITGKDAIGIILTGMGADGAKGLLKMRQAGARTIGQDKATSAVYGMPKVAYEMGAVEYQLPLDKIVGRLLMLV